MTFKKIFILEKLTEIVKYQQELKQLLEFSDDQIIKDSGKMHIAERLLQLIVDLMLDINQHFIKELNLPMVDDFQSTFSILGQHNILDKDFAQKIAPIVRLRNRVVHRYETLDKELFLNSIKRNYDDFNKYVELTKNYLENK